MGQEGQSRLDWLIVRGYLLVTAALLVTCFVGLKLLASWGLSVLSLHVLALVSPASVKQFFFSNDVSGFLYQYFN